MKLKQKLLTLVVPAFLVAPVFAGGISTAAYADCGGVATSLINCDDKRQCGDGAIIDNGEKCPDGSIPGPVQSDGLIWLVLIYVINILTAGVGVLAVAGLVYSAILYTSAQGEPDKVKKARTTIANVIVGLIAFVAMWAVLNFIVPGGVFR